MKRTPDVLQSLLRRIEGRSYKAYREIGGRWDFSRFALHIDHVQGDPFAKPSRVRVLVPAGAAGFASEHHSTSSRRTGVAWLLARRFAKLAKDRARPRGSGKSGLIRIESPGQEVLPQTATTIHSDGGVEARFFLGLPARGRSVLGRQAAELLLEDIPTVVMSSLVAEAYEAEEIWRHAATNEDAESLRSILGAQDLLAFVADGAILPRRSGVDDRPLRDGRVVPFVSPPELRQTFQLPHAGEVRGMGVPAGVTLIVGGGYHGKSTLLRAIERGIYNHCPHDGRELVVSREDVVKIRAEDGRSVAGVNISPFIAKLPQDQSTTAFCTASASGSTSQAAAIVEAIETGSGGLLIDEDTAATNFMLRDARMQALVSKDFEPITPFIDRVRQLYDECGVSSVLVIGGSGDYLDVADTVVAMQNFRPADLTQKARELVRQQPTRRRREAVGSFPRALSRRPHPASIDPSRGKRAVDIKVRSLREIQFGKQSLDLSAVEQLMAQSQTQAIANALCYASQHYVDGHRTLAEIVEAVRDDVEHSGLDVLDSRRMGNMALFRKHELAAAINRLRTLSA